MHLARISSAVFLCLAMLACGGGDEDEEKFTVPADAVRVGDSDIYLVGGEIVEAAPAPTGGSNAPAITAVEFVKTGTYEVEVHLDVDNGSDGGWVYLDFGDGTTYRVPVTVLAIPGGGKPITACGIAAEQQGIICTKACLDACSCLSCGSDDLELMMEQACALNCTVLDETNVLDEAPWNGSEKKVADVVYNGAPEYGLQGSAEAAGCNANICSRAVEAENRLKKVLSFRLSAPSFSTETIMTPQYASPSPTPEVSNQFAPAKLGKPKLSCNGHGY